MRTLSKVLLWILFLSSRFARSPVAPDSSYSQITTSIQSWRDLCACSQPGSTPHAHGKVIQNSLDLIISVKVSHSVTVSVYSLLTQYYCNFIPSWKETFENNLPYCGLSKETTSFEIFVEHIWPHRLICSYCASFSLELKFLRKIRIRVKNISHATTGATSLSSWHCLPRIHVSMKG